MTNLVCSGGGLISKYQINDPPLNLSQQGPAALLKRTKIQIPNKK